MTIHVTWDNTEQTIILYTVNGHWTWGELTEALAQGRALMDSVSHERVDFIVDMTDGNTLPSITLYHFTRLSQAPHPKSGLMVMTGVAPVIRALLDLLGRYQGVGARARAIMTATTIEEARAVLATLRREDTETL
jgi:hypothetical protein